VLIENSFYLNEFYFLDVVQTHPIFLLIF